MTRHDLHVLSAVESGPFCCVRHCSSSSPQAQHHGPGCWAMPWVALCPFAGKFQSQIPRGPTGTVFLVPFSVWPHGQVGHPQGTACQCFSSMCAPFQRGMAPTPSCGFCSSGPWQGRTKQEPLGTLLGRGSAFSLSQGQPCCLLPSRVGAEAAGCPTLSTHGVAPLLLPACVVGVWVQQHVLV